MNVKPLIIATLLLVSCGDKTPAKTSTPAPPQSSSAPVLNNTDVAPVKVPNLTPIERGAILYKRCKACHSLDNGGKHKVGPNLWAVYGSEAGRKNGFTYSKAFLASGIIWDTTTMDAFLTKPADYIKGNRMSFIGIRKPEDRDALQAYLKANTAPK